ncbi:bifunctional folylpolyglutamate synthase/dihydrofolate synthase [Falsibacillus pallidus]|uniref:Dihydrofolate synthase/folylpolyglutamate synthase n=1 Tax=Falsibacillus pallidus TaxID=493781 RepID=A0A370GKJ1_9BACI|nr:folylpolyglutamate synthase/dihydrofolate synthase family protein [Falsibacillus pallidus]RDI44167.1 dihydrofolate synthase/folylpolyglutamate synthase [Falsibacillus pallidus]
MINTYEEAIDWIHSRLRLGIKPGLKRMEWMMEKLGHPEEESTYIHVGGTNGKGSTVTYLRAILQEAGYSVGTFTSPYFEQFNERISVNGMPIPDQDLVGLVNVIKPLAEELEEAEWGSPTEFEVITAMAIYYFSKVNPQDIVIMEVGLGGRFDSTNIIHPIASAITSIGFDHMQILGDTLDKIAFEKAGIIKKGAPIFSNVHQEEAKRVIEEQAAEREGILYQNPIHFRMVNHHSTEEGEIFSVETPWGSFNNLAISMLGKHQAENAALASAILLYIIKALSFEITGEQLMEGLKKAFWPGRMERLSKEPLVYVDGAHNIEGLLSLKDTLENRFASTSKKIIFTALKDKDLRGMIEILDQMDAELYFTEFDFPRASTAAELYEISRSASKHYNNDWTELIQQVAGNAGEKDMVVITGSLYFLSNVKPIYLKFSKNKNN